MTDTSTIFDQSELDVKGKKDKEILVVNDQGIFTHETGDTYDGFFEAKKKDRSVKMHGLGVYTTAEGDVYSGVWDLDRLVSIQEDVEIYYSDGSKYKGKFKDFCYNSRGVYTYPDESVLSCEFVENAPTGNLQLEDPNGHIWLGKSGNGQGWLNPANHYYGMLESTRDHHRGKKHHKASIVETPKPSSYSPKKGSRDMTPTTDKKFTPGSSRS